MEKHKDSEKPEPTFDKQMSDYAVENIDPTDPIFSGRYLAFITGMLKKRDKTLMSEASTEFSEKVAEHYGPIMDSLKRIESKYDTLSEELIRLSKKETEDIRRLEEKIQIIIKRQDDKKKRIEFIEKTHFDLNNLAKAGEIVMKLDKKIKTIIYLTIGGFIGVGLAIIGHIIHWW